MAFLDLVRDLSDHELIRDNIRPTSAEDVVSAILYKRYRLLNEWIQERNRFVLKHFANVTPQEIQDYQLFSLVFDRMRRVAKFLDLPQPGRFLRQYLRSYQTFPSLIPDNFSYSQYCDLVTECDGYPELLQCVTKRYLSNSRPQPAMQENFARFMSENSALNLRLTAWKLYCCVYKQSYTLPDNIVEERTTFIEHALLLTNRFSQNVDLNEKVTAFISTNFPTLQFSGTAFSIDEIVKLTQQPIFEKIHSGLPEYTLFNAFYYTVRNNDFIIAHLLHEKFIDRINWRTNVHSHELSKALEAVKSPRMLLAWMPKNDFLKKLQEGYTFCRNPSFWEVILERYGDIPLVQRCHSYLMKGDFSQWNFSDFRYMPPAFQQRVRTLFMCRHVNTSILYILPPELLHEIMHRL